MGKSTIGVVLLLGSLIFTTQIYAGASKVPKRVVVHRLDLQSKMKHLICDKSRTLTTEIAWQSDLNDGQLEGRFYSPIHGSPAKRKDMLRRARSLAIRMHHLGFAAGTCADGSGWAVSVPSPVAIKQPIAQSMAIPQPQLNQYCRDYAIDYAPSSGGIGQKLAIENGRVSLKGLPPGTVSITCLPTHPSWLGPILWSLQPSQGKVPVELPSAQVLAPMKSPELALGRWINAIRRNEDRPALVVGNGALNQAANLLALGGNIFHNRKLLNNASDLLNRQNLRLIGEDRVRARTVNELAWHLWNSPRHRRLLLDSQGTHLGMAVQKTHDGYFAVLATASSNQGPISALQLQKSTL